jgi:site-specific recombinase XerD
MREDMLLSNLSQKTQESYINGVLKLARYYRRSPSDLSEEEVRNFILFLKDESGLSVETVRVSFYGIKFLCQKTLGRKWKIFDIIRIPQPNHFPVVLSFEEVKKILPHIYHPTYKMVLTLIYSCGLRLSECLNPRTEDIDSSRMLIRIKGKGNKYRNVPLPEHIVQLLRIYWRRDRPRPLLFPSGKSGGRGPIAQTTINYALKDACKKAGIAKKVTVHTLRHSYATHLLENGVHIRIIQGVLGHKSNKSKIRYTHLTDKTDQVLNKAVNKQMDQL